MSAVRIPSRSTTIVVTLALVAAVLALGLWLRPRSSELSFGLLFVLGFRALASRS